MTILRIRHTVWFLPSLVLAAMVLFPLAGRSQVKTEEPPESPEITNIIDRIIAGEKQFAQKMRDFSPRIETYIQYYRPDVELGDMPTNDAYFLGRLKFGKKAEEVSFIPNVEFRGALHFLEPLIRPLLPAHLFANALGVEPLVVDARNFDRRHYTFEPVRWEYLGDLRCLVLDVHPKDDAGRGAFKGRIWVEDRDYAIVRLNGTRINPARFTFYVHFDCWRENLQPGVWLPVYIYNQETDIGEDLRYKATTRFWGYDLTARQQQQEWTKILVDAPAPVRDSSEANAELSPVESQRKLEIDAERNVLDRLEKARLIAPPGPMDQVLETVVNNLVVTNHLDNLPPIHCRLMLSSPLESFTLRYTIVVSRGLIDVLPDEASLAMILAHELAHIVLGHKLDAKYAFNDRMQVTDEEVLASLDLARSPQDEAASDALAMGFLQNSPYKDKLDQVRLFLQEAAGVVRSTPHLFGAHLGNGLSQRKKLTRMSALLNTSPLPALRPKDLDQLTALPLGSRVKVNAWDGTVTFVNRKAVPLIDASEKMPFRVTPLIPYLKRYEETPKTEVAIQP